MLLTRVFKKFLMFHTVHDERLHFDALLFIYVCSDLKSCPSLLNIRGLLVISENPPCLLALVKTLHLLEVLLLLTLYAKTSISLKKPITSLKQILRWSSDIL